MSLPSRERGLKYQMTRRADRTRILVAPFTGAWIEILAMLMPALVGCVAPFTGAWIEIPYYLSTREWAESLPSRERGLKY